MSIVENDVEKSHSPNLGERNESVTSWSTEKLFQLFGNDSDSLIGSENADKIILPNHNLR